MTAATGHTDSGLPAAPVATIAGHAAPSLLAALVRLLERGRDKARALDQLARLDDRTLRDIGVHRSEISSILHYDRADPSRRSR